MELGIGLILPVFQAIVFLLVLIGTPLEMFRISPLILENTCITLWGWRECRSSTYAGRDFMCPLEKHLMNAGGAFAIISIFLTLVLLALFILKGKRTWMGIVSKVVGIICILTILIAWALAASVFHKSFCTFDGDKPPSFKELESKLGAGFGLLVAAWCLEIVVVVLSFIL